MQRVRQANQARAEVANQSAASSESKHAGQAGQGGQGSDSEQILPEAVQAHMQNARKHTLPSWSSPVDDTERLLEQMQQVQITITRVQTRENVVEAVAEYLREESIDGDLVVSPALHDDRELAWPSGTKRGAARDALTRGVQLTSVTPCVCAVAETGSIVTTSDADHPATNNYLPDNHVVVLHENQITRHVDGVWDLLRASPGVANIPRAVNFLTGPSRTADIEQTLELGAHGPRRMHVILVAANQSDG